MCTTETDCKSSSCRRSGPSGVALLVQVSVCRSLCCEFNNIQVLHALYCNFNLPPSARCHSPPVSPCLSLISVIRPAFAVVCSSASHYHSHYRRNSSFVWDNWTSAFPCLEILAIWPELYLFFQRLKRLNDILKLTNYGWCCLAGDSYNLLLIFKRDDTSPLPLISQKWSQNWALPSCGGGDINLESVTVRYWLGGWLSWHFTAFLGLK